MTSESERETRVGRLAILHPGGAMALGKNPFGKDVANLSLWRALARHGGYARLDVLALTAFDTARLGADLFGDGPAPTEVAGGQYLSSDAPREAGVLLRGQPYLADLAWRRRRDASDRAYSLVGLIHTLAPPAVREMIAASAQAPTHPWDALICTSPAVQEALGQIFDAWGEHLADRTGGRPPPRPALPLVPLGVEAEAVAAQADRPDVRARVRAGFGLGDDDVLVLWLGRLSYFEKAFPQPMLKALQQAQAATGARIAFVMAGWFPNDGDDKLYQAAAAAHAPGVETHFVDGNVAETVAGLWAGADIFLSLVDNIQETFGLTPLEAMAAGLPVVASDWDGYRYTVRDGIEGFLIPTLGGPASGGVGDRMAERHVLEAISYQAYVGAVAQHTAVHIGRAAQALADLIASPDLRRRMGQAGRARVREMFDWAVIARQVHALTDDLAAIRAAAPDPAVRVPRDPVKGDPFRAFSGFPTVTLTLDTRLAAAPGVSAEDVRAVGAVPLDVAFPAYRAPPDLCADAFTLIAERGGASVRDILLAFPTAHRRGLEMGLAWMAKCGFVDWLT